jgi:hypothetical protein
MGAASAISLVCGPAEGERRRELNGMPLLPASAIEGDRAFLFGTRLCRARRDRP